jgi:hypothetical protein
MKILLYFDWTGSRKEVKDWDNKMTLAAAETGVEYLGLHASMNKKYHYCAIYDALSYDDFLKTTWKVPRPIHMTHYITELLIPSRITS